MEAFPIGTIIVMALSVVPSLTPSGWIDISNTVECRQEIEKFRVEIPDAGEFRDSVPLGCIKKVRYDGVS